jgi:GTP cyclohydrolase II
VTPAFDGTLLSIAATPLDTVHGPFVAHTFHEFASGRPMLVVTRGDLRADEPLLARLHSSCVTSEVYGGCDCDCVEQLDAALARVAAERRGAIFYLLQEGRGAGFVAKARDRMLVQASGDRLTTYDAYAQMGLAKDDRRYGAVAAACRLLGVTAPLRLLTDNPDKVAALTAAGIAVDGVSGLEPQPSPWNEHYLAAKERAGHTFVRRIDEHGAATPPEPIVARAPHAVAGTQRFVALATYLLPIRLAEGPAWFRVHAYLDTERAIERVVLTHGDGAAPLVRLQPDTLLDRFPLRTPGLRQRWLRAAARIATEGAGCALFTSPHEAPDDAGALDLLATHLGGRRARPLVDAPDDGRLARALADRGIAVGAPVLLHA